MILDGKAPPTFAELVAVRLQDVSVVLDQTEIREAQLRFPVTVKAETRIWLELQGQALNGSLASVAGMILDSVAEASMAKQKTG